MARMNFRAVAMRFSFWRRRYPERFVAELGVIFGARCRFIRPTSATFGSEPYLIRLGEHVTVGEGVRFITHDGGTWVLRDKHPDVDVIAPIRVGDNVFIGSRAILLPGVRIGSNAVIAAGAVIARDVPDGTVVGGVPGRVITSITEYERRSLQSSLHTKKLDAKSKKRALLRHFKEDLGL